VAKASDMACKIMQKHNQHKPHTKTLGNQLT